MKRITSNILLAIALLLVLVRCNENKQRLAERNALELTKNSERLPVANSHEESPNGYFEYVQAISYKNGVTYPPNYRLDQFFKSKREIQSKRLAQTLNITSVDSRGPGNVGGRTTAIIVDPDDPTHSTWITGASGGGIWKTTDKGISWMDLSQDLPILSVNTLAMAPSNHDVIYVGTGDGSFGIASLSGDGLFKSTERGAVGSWKQLSSTAGLDEFRDVHKIIVNPSDENVVLVATNTGIYKSIDGGISWAEKYSKTDSRIHDISFAPNDFNVQYAALVAVGILKSVDAGETWIESTEGMLGTSSSNGLGARFEIATTPSNPNLVYTSTTNGLDETLLYRSDDQADSWVLVDFDPEASADGHFLDEQGWIHTCLAVNPFNENEVFIGGIYMGKYLISGEPREGEPSFGGVNLQNVDFLDFVNFGQTYFGGALAIADGPDPSIELFSVEIRFGSNISQMAHRFTVPAEGGANGDGGAGVPDDQYGFADYVEVPFEVWDVTNNRQLMISFRDQQRDGIFNLNARDDVNDPELLTAREYLFIHNIEYATVASSLVSVNGGHLAKNMYFFWPVLSAESTWDPSKFSTGRMRIGYDKPTLINGYPTPLASGSGGRTKYGRINPELHVDHLDLQVVPLNPETGSFMIVDANDGGLGLSMDNGATWAQITDGYITTQFYGADKKKGEDVYFGGMQDNGGWRSFDGTVADKSTHYVEVSDGDGLEVVWHAQDPNKMLSSYTNNYFSRTLTGSTDIEEWENAYAGIDGDGSFLTRVSSSRTHPDVLFAVGAQGVYKTTDFAELWNVVALSVEQGWTYNSTATGEPVASSANNVEVSLANHNIVWAGSAMFKSQVSTRDQNIFVSTNEGLSYKAINKFNESAGNISGIATHPFEDSTAYILFSFPKQAKIIRTTDLGETWEDISGFGSGETSANGFPDVMLNCLLVLPQNPETLWVGTDIGVFESTDNGNSWHYADIGLPAVSIQSMKVVDNQVIIGTYGRGIWTVTMSDLNITQSLIKSAEYKVPRSADLTLDFRADYDSVMFYSGGKWSQTMKDVDFTTLTTANVPMYASKNTRLAIQMVAYKNGVKYESAKQFTIFNFIPLLFKVAQNATEPGIVDVAVVIPDFYEKIEILVDDVVAFETNDINQTGIVTFEIPTDKIGSVNVHAIGYLDGIAFESEKRSVKISVINSIDITKQITIGPNPTNGILNISLDDLSANIEAATIYGMSGRKLREWNASREINLDYLDLTEFENGIYLLNVKTSKGEITKRIIKR